MSDESKNTESSESAIPEKARLLSLMRNFISFVGLAIVSAAVVSDLLLFLLEITATVENAYIGILTYIIAPSIMMFGLFVVAVGMFFERRRRKNAEPGSLWSYPKLDLNDARTRRSFMVFVIITFVFMSASAFGSYQAFEYTESVQFCGETCHTVMKPESLAHKAGAHARVRCVECHVGSGAGWYARSKLSGAYQLYAVSAGVYQRPIQTPVHNLRPAPDTCEQCHWPEKFYGAQMKVFTEYSSDEHNTQRQIKMLINVGGGSPAEGKTTGIHWHVNPANEVDYIASDSHRQVIPWVSAKDKDGNTVEYYDRKNPISPDEVRSSSRRKMDCVDCHNRPAHAYLPPDTAINNSLAGGTLDASLPFLKQQGVEVLIGKYETNEEAVAAIDKGITDFYRSNYPGLYAQKADAIRSSISELQRIYQTYFFPEMKTDWTTHPNNIGHKTSVGCFRCHDGEHFSNTGKVITSDCNICHTTIYDSAGPPERNSKTGPFQHPVDLGALADRKCESCHRADKPFKHPIELGDISRFQCAVCHPRKT